MNIYVKMVRGGRCKIAVTGSTPILAVKRMVELKLRVPVAQQFLVFEGRTLLDANNVASYKIKDGLVISLVVKKVQPFDEVLEAFLAKYYDEQQRKAIVDAFMTHFRASLKDLSLDDLEAIATAYLNDDTSH